MFQEIVVYSNCPQLSDPPNSLWVFALNLRKDEEVGLLAENGGVKDGIVGSKKLH